MGDRPDDLSGAAEDDSMASFLRRVIAPDEPDPVLAEGTRLGRYTIARKLGQGGMGVVYAAYDPTLDREVALKLLRGRSGEAARGRLVREARAMAKLAHPNVVVVFEVGTADEHDYVAMELVDGDSLDRWLAQPRDTGAIIATLLAAGRGLAAAHERKLVHRDFKLHNVLVGRDGRVLVTDFGLARSVGELGDTAPTAEAPITGEEDTVAPAITVPGAVVGTPGYMAPEQWDGAPCDARADQFAYCVALWHALAGELPYRARDFAAVPTSDRIPGWLVPILRRGLARDPAARWPSLGALLATLERGARRSRRWLVAGAAVAAAGVAAATYAIATRAPDRDHAADRSRERDHSRDRDRGMCSPLDERDLWTAARRERMTARLAADPAAWTALDRRMTRLDARFGDAITQVCDRPDTAQPVRVACLVNWRAETVALLDAVAQVPPDLVGGILYDLYLSPLRACLTPTPFTPPSPPPADRAAAVHALRVDIVTKELGGPGDFDDLARRADALGYQPIVLDLAYEAAVRTREWDHDRDAARRQFEAVMVAAEAAALPLTRAHAAIQLAKSAREAHIAADDAESVAAIRVARVAIAAAGNDPVLASEIDLLEASRILGTIALDLDENNHRANPHTADFERALALQRSALAARIEGDDFVRSVQAASAICDTYINRHAPGDLARARDVLAAEIARQVAILGEHATPYLDHLRHELELVSQVKER